MNPHRHKFHIDYLEEEICRLPMQVFCTADLECDRKLVLTVIPPEIQVERMENFKRKYVPLPPAKPELLEEVRKAPRVQQEEDLFQ
jgi:hypothetical protein